MNSKKKPTPKILKYQFMAKLWKHKGAGGWHFVTLPKALSTTIRKNHGASEEGWGRLKASARIGKTNWKTAIWYDSRVQCYLLPVKAIVRRAENLEIEFEPMLQVVLVMPEDRI